jgi:hypothetical protein
MAGCSSGAFLYNSRRYLSSAVGGARWSKGGFLNRPEAFVLTLVPVGERMKGGEGVPMCLRFFVGGEDGLKESILLVATRERRGGTR